MTSVISEMQWAMEMPRVLKWVLDFFHWNLSRALRWQFVLWFHIFWKIFLQINTLTIHPYNELPLEWSFCIGVILKWVVKTYEIYTSSQKMILLIWFCIFWKSNYSYDPWSFFNAVSCCYNKGVCFKWVLNLFSSTNINSQSFQVFFFIFHWYFTKVAFHVN